jgi:hypothetical protein
MKYWKIWTKEPLRDWKFFGLIEGQLEDAVNAVAPQMVNNGGTAYQAKLVKFNLVTGKPIGDYIWIPHFVE